MKNRKLEIFSLVTVLAICAGCGRDEIRVYTARKDPAPRQEEAHGPNDGHDHGEQEPAPRVRPQVTWKLPAGWREIAPGRMSLASFSIPSGSEEAQVTITPLPMLGGRDAMIVNMWREQVGLKPLEESEVAQQLQDVVVGGENGKLFEVAGKSGEGEKPARIITAMVHRSDASWFYKLSGDAGAVEKQKPAFIEFLKSIEIKDPSGGEPATTTDNTSHKWEVPSTWKSAKAGQMQVARFSVPGGEVFVSVFPSDTGGTLANVNRWRRQLSLPEVDEKGLAALVGPLDASAPNAVLVDMSNDKQRMLGAIVPRGAQWWFYKLLGESAAVGAERDNFIRFAKSNP